MSVDAPLLAIETSTTVGSVAVGIDGRAIVEVTLAPPVRHAAMVLPSIEHVLSTAGVAREELSGVVIGGGPGSFTGLRIAAATGKGLCHALEIPLFAYSGLAALAVRSGVKDEPVCALLDARRGEVYAACYRVSEDGIETLYEPAVVPAGQLPDEAALEGALYVGEGAVANREALEAAGVRLARPADVAPSAGGLLWLARHAAEAGRVESAAAWEPDYVRASSAERGVAG